MKNLFRITMFQILGAILLTLTSSLSMARDTRHMLKYLGAVNGPRSEEVLSKDIKFFYGDEKVPSIETDFGEVATNRKTNAFNKSDEEACQWAFLSAFKALSDRAREMGGNAVVQIRSNYKGHLMDSKTEFECGAGAVVAGVAFKARIVKLKK